MYGRESKLLAGGTDIIPLMKRNVIAPRHIINLKGIQGLNLIKPAGTKGVRMGALTTIQSLKENGWVRKNLQSLHEAACAFGTFQVRNMATIGGNLCRASPAADLAPPLLTFDANVTIVGPRARRGMPLADFFLGPGRNVLKCNEILTDLTVQGMRPHTGTAFSKIGRTCEDLAKINVAARVTVSNGICKEARVALGAVAPTPMRAKRAERTLVGKKLDMDTIDRAAQIAADETMPVSDTRSTAEYRKEVSRVMVNRTIHAALERVT
jgi:carbon-monoxide dehydrogenase medium subunit